MKSLKVQLYSLIPSSHRETQMLNPRIRKTFWCRLHGSCSYWCDYGYMQTCVVCTSIVSALLWHLPPKRAASWVHALLHWWQDKWFSAAYHLHATLRPSAPPFCSRKQPFPSSAGCEWKHDSWGQGASTVCFWSRSWSRHKLLLPSSSPTLSSSSLIRFIWETWRC